jgi:hypothetical protein
MKTYYQNIGFLTVIVCLLLFPQTAPAQDKSLEQRISTLEYRIKELEDKVRELQKTASQTSQRTAQSPAPVAKGNWKNIENWRTGLKKGMTKQQVRELMGEPDKIETYTMLGEDWIYGFQGSGEIHFSPKGLLETWKEPIPDDLK